MDEKDGHGTPPNGSIEYHDEWKKLNARFSREYKKADEYGTMVLLHRWLDTTLTRAIKTRFAPDTKTAASKLFSYPGGLSSFSARAHLARCLGLFGSTTYADLKIINEIRNEFAHPSEEYAGGMEVLGFRSREIQALCKKLGFLDHSAMPPANYRRFKGEHRLFVTVRQIVIALWVVHLTPSHYSESLRSGALP